MRNKILFVEDTLRWRETIIKHLMDMGVPREQIVCAHDVASGKKEWDDHKEEIGVVLTDGNYPGGGAGMLIKYIRLDNGNMPIILISVEPDKAREITSFLAAKNPAFQNVPVFWKACLFKCQYDKCGTDGQEGFIPLLLKTIGFQIAAKPEGPGSRANFDKAKPA